MFSCPSHSALLSVSGKAFQTLAHALAFRAMAQGQEGGVRGGAAHPGHVPSCQQCVDALTPSTSLTVLLQPPPQPSETPQNTQCLHCERPMHHVSPSLWQAARLTRDPAAYLDHGMCRHGGSKSTLCIGNIRQCHYPPCISISHCFAMVVPVGFGGTACSSPQPCAKRPCRLTCAPFQGARQTTQTFDLLPAH